MRRLTQNLAFCIAIGVVAVSSYGAETIHWETDLQAAARQAEATNRPLLLHFWTPECAPCKRLEQTVFNQARVANVLQDFFVPVKIDANQHPNLAARYGVEGVPLDVVVAPNGEELHRMFSPLDPDQYIAQLSAVAFRAGATRSSAQVARSDYPRTGEDLQAGDRWPSQAQSPLGSPDRDRGDSRYARSGPYADSQELPPYDPSSRSLGGGREVPEDEPREVINRFARRSPAEGAGPESQLADSAPSRDAADATSRWGSWPQRKPTADSPTRESAPESLDVENRYVSERETRPTGPPPAAADRRGVEPASASRSTPPLGMDGYCPVSLIRKNAWTKGDPRFGVIHRGRTYLFAGPEEKEIFFADPDEYSPVLVADDPVELAATGETAEGERAHGVVYRKRVYLFASEANLQKFWEEPERYASPIRQAMETGDVGRLFR